MYLCVTFVNKIILFYSILYSILFYSILFYNNDMKYQLTVINWIIVKNIKKSHI